ncbi:tetratricopeptide repeat protein [Nonomuraea recticatena]|uniref:tetratricopeptide repeat protein n=1 Tax=Nonomuraea recticatena TaxID=46178 RepID=UPI00360AC1BD
MTWWQNEQEVAAPAVPAPRSGDEPELLVAAQHGDAQAAHRLGKLYAQRGDRSAARHWWERAASGGNIDSAYNLGVWHEKHGTLEEAVRWYELAAGTGDAEAAVNLATLLLEQRGDIEAARRWFESAAHGGPGRPPGGWR